MSIRSQLTGATFLLCIAGSALAASTAHLSAGHLTYTLVDLTPDDGIAPSITFGAQPFTYFQYAFSPEVRAGSWDGAMSGGGGTISQQLWTRENASQADTHGNSTALASLSGRLQPETTQLALDGRVDRTGDRALSISAVFSGPTVFELSANTAVVFSADSHITASLNEDPGATLGLWAFSRLGLHKPGYNYELPQWTTSEVWYIGTSSKEYDLSQTLTMEYRNDTTEAVVRAVDLQAQMSLRSEVPVIPDVPEPATWMSLAAGLGLVGLWRRRQQQ
ncbi:PEP-CTERM sorting domain-containing protein [Massilia sp. YMA4]|uniref:PEP-CTERM sorting domain-containing protein n=1 Tax=Massilia sp. YMA4 TaxID=1593482 RepID=UPI000DD1106F|nr:PEP-CTERM sorting domain-containing protein [Massilia sp. YMA4]AXA89714.1 hypothetical protein DPH57_00085 [Massilia sp. YMA4]